MIDQEIKNYIAKQVAQQLQALLQTSLKEPEESKDDLTHCCCDFTAHCPIHGSRSFNPDSYIAQG